ncbi:MAG: UDP-N-acetylglucosamine--N-acetylmuramyl-(pentapeptide) pyrophosphoryl-undecaprenol N-acetylglucosamine transferase, partial [Actinobacteria bacterium]|nr:UDP-N-acetylglucosamine--N-acetylmuramyl-(pentapeptide) pyrophosphoryl-undecaprenol N-acetylglucosamine transferase [Actinomycetota bacterium]
MSGAAGGRVGVVVTGGGTGGHVYPAIAVADELVRRGHDRAAVRFLGSARGMEARAVPAAGYAIELLPGRGFRRSVAPGAIVQNLQTAWDTVVAAVRAVLLLRRWRPAVVFGVGGYAAAPGVIAARLLRIPVVVHEQNAAPGVVNRLAVRLGARAAVSLPGTALPGAVLTGNPVRAAIVEGAARSDAGGPGAPPGGGAGGGPVVGVFGGSLGARRINDATVDLARRWRDRGQCTIRHVTGSRDYQRCVDEWSKRPAGVDALRYEMVEFEDDMAGLYARADVVVTRAGAVTVAELAVSGTPAVVVPLPGAPSDHQTANGRALATAGAAVL